MRSLVMSLFSRDLLLNYIRYLQCLNLVNNYLHEYNIYTAPGFLDGRTSILVLINVCECYAHNIQLASAGLPQAYSN